MRAYVGDTQPETQGLELDLPLVSEDGSSVALTVRFKGNLHEGETLEEIRVFATRNPYQPVIDFRLSEAITRAEFSTRIRLAETQYVHAVARSSEERKWVTSREVRVTVSGCLMDADDAGERTMSNPRVALGSNARQGEPVPIRTLINHPMETGLRDGEPAPDVKQQLVETLTVNQGEAQLFQARFHTGTSANPYVQFHLTPEQPGDLEFVWRDQNGDAVRQTEPLQF